jgi:hypothetical protein
MRLLNHEIYPLYSKNHVKIHEMKIYKTSENGYKIF